MEAGPEIRSETHSQERSCYEDEIDIREIFRVISRQKKIVILTTAVFFLAACIYVLMASSQYEMKIQVKSGLQGWPKEDIVSWLKEKQYLNLFQKPDKKEAGLIRRLKFRQERKGEIVTLYLLWPDPDEGRQFLEKLTSRWIDYYLKKFPDEAIVLARSEIGKQIDELQQELKSLEKIGIIQLENRIAEKTKLATLTKAKIQTLKKQIEEQERLLNYFEKTAEKVIMNTDALMKARDELIINGRQQDLSALFLLNSIQQNISYADQVKRRMVDIQDEIYQKQNRIHELKGNIEQIQNSVMEMRLKKSVELQGKKDFLEKQIKDLQYQYSHIAPVKVLAPAINSLKPVRPRKALILALSTVAGFFIGIFAAFFRNMMQNGSGDVQ